jgi:hypothetical protein
MSTLPSLQPNIEVEGDILPPPPPPEVGPQVGPSGVQVGPSGSGETFFRPCECVRK